MKKLILYASSLLLSTLLYAHPDEPTPPSASKVVWHSITVIDYKPGTVDAAKELIQKFETASEKAGTPPPVTYWFESGKYDLVVTWVLNDGPVDMKGSWSPDGVKWWDALVEQEGSEEAAKQLQTRYNELIASSVTNVARKAK
jgi:hypothetical protein